LEIPSFGISQLLSMPSPLISVVTPTYLRPEEVVGLLESLSSQSLFPFELVLVDGAPPEEQATEQAVKARVAALPYRINYIRHGGGTAIQRNVGIDAAKGGFIAFIDDDIRLEPGFFEAILHAFSPDREHHVGGIVGYRVNDHFTPQQATRWRWYRRLGLLTTYEPGRYDFETGFPINANLQMPFCGVREVDFMTTACTVWRREVMDQGLRFDEFFKDYGVLEDAHFSLTAGKRWKLLQCGDARCRHEHSLRGRVNRKRLGFKCVVNYYYVFQDIAGPLRRSQKYRFWRYQMFELLRIFVSGVRRLRFSDFQEAFGRLQGFWAVAKGAADRRQRACVL
jgi:glycosyltransferase involved in cell wall biosynthesis